MAERTPFQARVIAAYQALPRNDSGKLPSYRSLETAHRLPEGALSKAVAGGRAAFTGPTIARMADALRVPVSWLVEAAAAILAPRPAFRRAGEAFGEDFAALAGAFVATQSLAVLRWGEVYDVPIALVTPESVRVRGPEWTWPEEQVIRRWARAAPDYVARRDLTDAHRRVVLRAA